MEGSLIHADITSRIIGAAIEVHRELGPGLLENAYEECLCYELSQAGLKFQRQLELPVRYKRIRLDCGYRADLLVEACVLLELKAIEAINPVHEAQLLTYLRISQIKVGLLINFNCETLKDGIHRRVL
ncbi:MAG: GxxExxY protein [Planctomycetota bacterium]|nr:MAG: GxxExxY protein [Planctomycetota bacterium]